MMLRTSLFATGAMLCGLSGLMLAAAGVDLLIGADKGRGLFLSFCVTAFVGVALILALRPGPGETLSVSRRDAFVLVAMAWVALPAFGALPFMFSTTYASTTDAVFESVSGLTTTGSTIFSGLDVMDRGVLLWRSLLQWFGGVGIILMAVIMLPFLRVGGMQLFQVESSDRTSERLIARPVQLVSTIAGIYVGLTLACAIAYGLAGMRAFDAINHAMTTVSTGGFSTHDSSLGFFDDGRIYVIAIVFMIAGALPFLAYVRSWRDGWRSLFTYPQVATFLTGLAIVILIGGALLDFGPDDGYHHRVLRVAVNTISVVTTTGFATEDYTLWGPGFVGLFFALTFLGGCAGSTTGGVKVYRLEILSRFTLSQTRRLYQPSRVQSMSFGGKPVDADLVLSILGFLAAFVGVLSVGAVALAFTGLDFVTALTGAVTAICNVGPGLGPTIGPAGNFASLNDLAKWILIALMLFGRLELFAFLVLMDPNFWRR